MQRLKDYAGFGVWFVGLGYIVVLALSGPLGQPVAVDLHLPALSPMLHVIGLLAAITVFVRLLVIALRRTQKSSGEAPPSKSFRRFRRPASTVKRIKGRDHFGLRGLPR